MKLEIDKKVLARIKHGEKAEKRFESFCKIKNIWYQRFGLSTREGYWMGIKLSLKVPKTIRGAPDYWAVKDKFHFVECKMADEPTGTHVKVKEHDMLNYNTWANVGSLQFFIHNLKPFESYLVKYNSMVELINNCEYEKGMYPDNGKHFYKVKMDDIRRVGRAI